MKIKNRTAIVTGGASGLGKATAIAILKKGGNVVIFDWSDEKGTDLIDKYGERVLLVKTNVAVEESVKEGIERVIQKFGEISMVINCAGIVIAKKIVGKEGAHPLLDFKKVIDINLIGTFNVIRLTAEKMQHNPVNKNGERGVIINTASVAAFEGQIGQTAYSASKGAIVGMTLPLARDLSCIGIRVCSIAPGLFLTPILESLPGAAIKSLSEQVPFPHRLGRPSEFGNLVISIIENPMLNGETIRIDGGMRAGAK